MSTKSEPIAVVGSGCRFPGHADTPSKLWDIIRDPKDLLAPIPKDRFSGYYHENGQYHGHGNVKESYLLSGAGTIKQFDAQFFGISPAEANAMDPQMRLLLETVYEAVEASGHTVDSLRGSDTAVYTGLMVEDYEHVMMRDEEYIGTYHITGTSRALMSNRVSYFFDWHGPSMTLDTACSSSLVAVHQAVQQLRTGQARVAVAAGANLLLDSQYYIGSSKLRMLSPNSRSRMWDAEANGYARGEGLAAIVLKPLSEALADGDDIECVIRETGVNQDGKTQVLTQPSPEAQCKLIRDVYTRAGLDPSNPEDRPHYFEAHGTGTQAGDPIEAEAISTAFFPGRKSCEPAPERLIVGGIKTVIGHTEGTAGLAGFLKTSLVLQNATIPPNLLFNKLNLRIEPFYGNLHLPTESAPWPTDSPHRRASVNSFGFGGTNAHAILENYVPDADAQLADVSQPILTPFTFSAASESSLFAYIQSFCDYLREHGNEVNLRNVAYTLHSRRTRFPVATCVAASSASDLCEKLEERLEAVKKDSSQSLGTRPSYSSSDDCKPQVLGIFTGQGAQWARQGYELVAKSQAARQILESLEQRLTELPEEDRPSWSLLEELGKDASETRIGDSVLSQPLCTAVQILQIDLLRATGLKLAAVVGHSSGEIAAAYAAELISAGDAICIAYYRGMHSELARGPDDQAGAMMAVGTSLEDIQELCESPDFQGRVKVAAINSSNSVTVSGDKDAISQMQIELESDQKFARTLKVNKAYHSHHMLACSEAYIASLRKLNVAVGAEAKCAWFSSVNGGDMMDSCEPLKGEYWDRNLTNPVQFMQALQSACTFRGPFDIAVEIGPHPALKSPASQTIGEVLDKDIPYTGLLSRGKDDVESVATGLGYIWNHLGKGVIDLQAYDQYLTEGTAPCRLVKGLPKYAWNHDTEYWHESRYAKATRSRTDALHSILGHLTPDSTEQNMRWRHVLRPKELPWLSGHRLQDQTVFPAAGYVCLAVEAARAVCKDMSISLIDVLDLEIGKALTFDNDNTSVEAVFGLTDVVRVGDDAIEATFAYNAASADKHGETLDLLANGRLRVSLGEYSEKALPGRGHRPPNLLKVQTDDFYSSLLGLDYGYSPPFTALSGLERVLGAGTGYISNEEESDLLVHPAVLDCAFQTIFLAHSAPFDGGLWAMHVPKTIRSVRINPNLCASNMVQDAKLPFDSVQPAGTSSVGGDVDIFADNSDHAMIQVEGLECVPFSEATAKDDREMFSTTVWDVAFPNGESIASGERVSADEVQLAHLLERIGVFYLRQLQANVPSDHESRTTGPHTSYYKFASHMDELVKSGGLHFWRTEWDNDTHETIDSDCEAHKDDIDIRLLRTIGENIVDIATGKKQGIELAMKDDMLSEYYESALGWPTSTQQLAKIVSQIVHRFPHMDILEVGAGTGGATKGIFQEICDKFDSFTYTDISSGFFDTAKEVLSGQADRMTFKVLDISKDPVDQGFQEHSYDLVVASMVLHATAPLEETMRNVRRLLKPGGFLVAFEGHNMNVSRMGTLFGAFPGWWVGEEDGRVLSPFLSMPAWDELLRRVGFSGCDAATPDINSTVKPFTIFASQAVDGRISFLREPLVSGTDTFPSRTALQDVILLGGTTLKTSRLVGQLGSLLRQFCGNVKTVRSLPELSAQNIHSSTTILSLTELDEPLFKNLSESTWLSTKSMLLDASQILWVTKGRRADDPHANMMLGMMRSALREIPTLDIQFLDIEDDHELSGRTLAEALLRFCAGLYWHHLNDENDMLTTLEPEVILDKEGQLLIPRLVPSSLMNDRYNSTRRPIISRARLSSQQISLATSVSGRVLHRAPSSIGPVGTATFGTIRTSHSLLSAVRVARLGCMFLLVGTEQESKNEVVALSTKHTLWNRPWQNLMVTLEDTPDDKVGFLSRVAHHLLCSIILNGLTKGDRVLVHEPNTSLAAIMSKVARQLDVEILFTTESTISVTSAEWRSIHPSAPERVIQSLDPKHVAVFVDFSQSASNSLGERIRSNLSIHCRYEDVHTLFDDDSWAPLGSHISDISSRLENAVASAQIADNTQDTVPQVPVSPSALIDKATEMSPNSVIDWSSSSDVPVQVEPVDSQVMFSSTKTYWLAGLTGGLGLSLCEWMVKHGAKYIVISSRQPKIKDSWLDYMRSMGAVISIRACDITNRDDIGSLYAEIRETLPPIGGVAQGAMVLQDLPFRDMSLEAISKVTRPKVDGSIYLNELFQDNSLDFFVFFSSLAAVTGNLGQSNYSAANCFMSSLAEQRRQRGLAASVMNIGPVLGVGYIAQQDLDLKSVVKSGSFRFVSEQDFHKHFAEAIVAGRPGSTRPMDITVGLTRVSSNAENQPTWASNPFMSHFIRNRDVSDRSSGSSKSSADVQTQLTEAQTLADVYAIIRDAFLPKLAGLYQLDADKLASEDISCLQLDTMGTDSLLAVEIRSWFMKTLKVNIPVLKILSGASVGELVTIASESLPDSMVPSLQGTSTGPDGAESGKDDSKRPPTLNRTQGFASPSSNSSSGTHGSDSPNSVAHETQASSPPLQPEMIGSPQTDGKMPSALEETSIMSELEKTAKLSFSQDMFWFVTTFLKDKSALNHTGTVRMTGKLVYDDFVRAIHGLCQQHESLRTCFFIVDSQPVQGVMQFDNVSVEYRKIVDEGEVDQVYDELKRYTYDLEKGETMKAIFLSHSETTTFLVMGTHGLVLDGTSFQVLLRDLQYHYAGGGDQPDTLQYIDYSEQQNKDYADGKMSEDLQFWRRELASFPPPLPILNVSKAVMRPMLTTYDNERIDIRIDIDTKNKIKALCRSCRVTPFHFYLATLRVLLSRYADAEDVSIGIAEANRGSDKMMDSVGSFVNLLPLRFQNKSDVKFEDLVKEARTKAYTALSHSQVPFQVLLNELDAPRSASCSPIFQAFVDYRQGQREKQSWGDCQLELLAFQASKMAYDVSLDIIDDPDGECLIMLISRQDLYDHKATKRLADSYERLVKAFADQPGARMDEPQEFGDEETSKVLAISRGPLQVSKWPDTIVHRFEDIARDHGNEPAIRSGDGSIATYQDVLDRSKVIACALQEAGSIIGARVAVLQEPTSDWVSSILAIMRVGGVYIPLDLGNPWSRLSTMVEDCRPSLVLVDAANTGNVENLAATDMVAIDISTLREKKGDASISCSPSDSAVIYYTSGSSGKPKGIVLQHEGIRNWFESIPGQFDMASEQVLQQSSSNFDMSLIQIFTALCHGGCVNLIPRSLRGDARAISDFIHSCGITFTCACPSEYTSWLKYGSRATLSQCAWRRVLCGGEPMTDSILHQFYNLGKQDLRLFNVYGPTEITFIATGTEVDYNPNSDASFFGRATAGGPLPNYSVYVLTEQKRAVPAGVQGEIYVGGPGVVSGYLNNPALTKERFVDNVLASKEDIDHGWNVLHRTGDLGRWTEDGGLLLEGRISGDTQVKLRGLRIDLREVESAMLSKANGALSEAVVSAQRSSPGRPEMLVAHVVFSTSYSEDDREQLLTTLQSQLDLPRYMCPSVIVPIDVLPMTDSRKLDRKAIAALPLPTNLAGGDCKAELSATETKLRDTWEEVISDNVGSLRNIGPDADFFHVGGTSLLLLGLQGAVRSTFGVELSLTDMFGSSTLGGMATKIEGQNQQGPIRNGERIDWQKETQLSPALMHSVSDSVCEKSNGKHVVLTGATGFLGRGILDALIQDASIETVHCIALRNLESRDDLKSIEKTVLYGGDLIQPRLGLSEEDEKRIFSTADVVIHNGADVSYMKTYTSLRLPNLASTKQLAEMCAPRKIPFHFISTAGACSFAAAAGASPLRPVSVSEYPPPSDSSGGGYASSKWASEVFLEKLKAAHTVWPIWVHRPSNITRETEAQFDLAWNIRHYSRALKAVPIARDAAVGSLDAVSLGEVVRGVMEAIKTQHEGSGSEELRFTHLIGGVDLPLDNLRSWVGGDGDDEVEEEIAFERWTELAEERGMHPTLVAFMQNFAKQGSMAFPKLLKE